MLYKMSSSRLTLYVSSILTAFYLGYCLSTYLNTEIRLAANRGFVKRIKSTGIMQPNGKETFSSYLVYDCSKLHKGACGGLSDRLSGMMSVYIMSILTKKKFLIFHDNPYQLSEYLYPNKYDWTFNDTILQGKSRRFHNFFCKTPEMIKNFSKTSMLKVFSADVNFIQMNWDYTKHFRKFEKVYKFVPWVTQLQTSDMYAEFFNYLFKPRETITSYVEHIIKTRKKKLACAHIRIGGSKTIPGDDPVTNPRQLGEIWNFLLDMDKKNYSIFVATDSDDVASKARTLFKENLIVTPGTITHMDKSTKRDMSKGVRKSFLEFFLLTKCHELIVTRSGFGVTAAYLNEIHEHLHCFKEGSLIPCSRYTLGEYLPGIFFSPY